MDTKLKLGDRVKLVTDGGYPTNEGYVPGALGTVTAVMEGHDKTVVGVNVDNAPNESLNFYVGTEVVALGEDTSPFNEGTAVINNQVLVSPPSGSGKVSSDGSSSSYYFLPAGATELNDLIEFKEMSFARGNLFKALYRLGEKEGIDHTYDLNKCQLFLDRLKAMQEKGRRL